MPANRFLCLFLLQVVISATARTQEVDPSLCAVNGEVRASFVQGRTLYIGGSFDQVGPVTGGGVLFEVASGRRLPFPEVAGSVQAAVPDGNGGWFLGGRFAWVGGIRRHNLVHVLADNTVAAWDPDVNGGVSAMTRLGGILYVGGAFDTIGAEPRHGLAAFDTGTGDLTPWSPPVEGHVLGIDAEDRSVFISAFFMKVAGKSRMSGLAAVDATTGRLLPWNPPVHGWARCLALSKGTMYIGGRFDRVGPKRRDGVAALDTRSGLVKPWDPGIRGLRYCDSDRRQWRDVSNVSEIAVGESTLYVGGNFETVGERPALGFAAVDAVSGKAVRGRATVWSSLTESPWVTALLSPSALAVCDSTLVVAGHRESWRGVHLLAFNRRTREGRELATPDGAVLVLAWDGHRLFVGGEFRSCGGKSRRNLAAIDLPTGKVTPWNPSPDGEISAITATDSAIYVGGQFTRIGEERRRNLAALDPVFGVATDWDPSPDAPVNALATVGGQIIVAGFFNRIGGRERARLAALVPRSTEVTEWNPNPRGGSVDAVAAGGATLFVGGFFDSVGGAARRGIAELDLVHGAATPWSSATDRFGLVRSIAVSDQGIFVGGRFDSVGAHERRNLALLDLVTGEARSWTPGTGRANETTGWPEPIMVLAVMDSIVYAGEGDEFSASGLRLRALDMASGKGWSLPDVPIRARDNPVRNIFTISVSDSLVIAGGDFTTFGPHPASGIVAIRRRPGAAGTRRGY